MTKKDWTLVTAWVLFVALVGPWLVSAASNIAVILGVLILLGLVVLTVKRVKEVLPNE